MFFLSGSDVAINERGADERDPPVQDLTLPGMRVTDNAALSANAEKRNSQIREKMVDAPGLEPGTR